MKYVAIIAAVGMLAAPAIATAKDWKFGDGTTPERWSLVNKDYALCDAGLMQSPVDLGQANARGDISVSTNYGKTTGKLEISDQKLQVNFPAGLTMHSGDKHFNLIQVHFHTPSEHAVNGKRYPLVAHFVHATDAGELGVLDVMFKEGAANPALAKIGSALDSGSGTSVEFDASTMLPTDLSVYRYMGSLTTPPCSEGVNWHVATEVIEASPEQIGAMTEVLGPTARSLQPLGNRLLVAPKE